MSDKNKKNSQNVVIMPEPSVSSDPTEKHESVSSDEDEVIELRRTNATPPAETKPLIERKREGLARARAILQQKREQKRMEDEKARRMIEKAYEAEMEEKVMKETIPRYSKQIKKQILERLKQRKLAELKAQYGYESSESESEESESESEEEEVVVVKKKKAPAPKKEVKQQVKVKQQPVVEVKKPLGLLDRMKMYGF